jgi:hypothetical protein
MLHFVNFTSYVEHERKKRGTIEQLVPILFSGANTPINTYRQPMAKGLARQKAEGNFKEKKGGDHSDRAQGWLALFGPVSSSEANMPSYSQVGCRFSASERMTVHWSWPHSLRSKESTQQYISGLVHV